MSDLEHFEIHAVFRPTGQVSVEQAADMVTKAIAFARERRISKLLIDATDLTGFEPPSIASRFFFIDKWARAANGAVCVAFVARPELIDPRKFGRTAAANLGFTIDAFTTLEEALQWLHRAK
jgi:hypothetical protein